MCQDIREGSVLTFSAEFIKLPFMDALMVDLVVHGLAPKEEAVEEIKVGLDEMDNSELIQLDAARLFIDHDVNDLCPSF
jgi:hypothetical protein